jgi:hypothetical protein
MDFPASNAPPTYQALRAENWKFGLSTGVQGSFPMFLEGCLPNAVFLLHYW